MDITSLGSITFNWEFVSGLFSIFFINIILSGDNAVLIAMAVRSLPRRQRTQGIVFGSLAAVVLRIILTFFAAQLLQVSFIKLVGGILVSWIAIKLFTEDSGESALKKEVTTFTQALRIIIVADLVMSLDNVLAVAAASAGNFYLLVFGLLSSIPLVVGTSTLISSLMDRFPIIIYAGAAILGKVGGEMVITDPFVVELCNPSKVVAYSVEAIFTIGVIIVGRMLLKRKRIQMQKEIDIPHVG
jgi:YjbE family integral membrane protein